MKLERPSKEIDEILKINNTIYYKDIVLSWILILKLDIKKIINQLIDCDFKKNYKE